MVLLVLIVLAVIPLFGVALLAMNGSLFPHPTIDALFMSLILLAMSGIMGATALFEVRKRLKGSDTPSGKGGRISANSQASAGPVRRGTVKDVAFYEAHVGEPNKSLVTLSNGASLTELLVLSGDVRNALPIGQKVQITLRKEAGLNILADVRYS